MAGTTKIEWTDDTWNPVTGCRRVSEGCKFCYAERMAHRLAAMGQTAYQGLTQMTNGRPQWNGLIRELPERLGEPLKWRQPRRVFVNSMSDLFHEAVSDAFLDRVFAVMALAPQHQFQILTKRPERMRDYCGRSHPGGRGFPAAIRRAVDRWLLQIPPEDWLEPLVGWPLPNVWLGVSCEDQPTANARIPLLLQTPAAVRFISAEPLLGPVDLSEWVACMLDDFLMPQEGPSLDWVIAGAESGSGARPMDLDWVRLLRDQCEGADVAFFFKQAAVKGRKIHLPELDGRQWAEYPVPAGGS